MISKLNKSRIINKSINIITVVIFIAAIIPFLITTKYGLFVTDDFPLANAVVRNYDGSYFRTGIKCATSYWRVWNGNWFSFFVGYGLHPIVHGGQKVLAAMLFIQLTLAIMGSVFFCYSLSSFFNLKPEKTLRIIALIVLPVLLFKEYFDLYLWWLTSCTYLMPLYFFLFGLGTFLFALKSDKTWEYIVAGILLLAMSGGSLNVVGMGCYSLLFLLIAWGFYKKRVSIPGVVVFVVVLVGACINAFAPGNFARQNGQETEKIGVVKVLLCELKILGVEGKWLVLHTAFVAFALLAFFWGSRLNKKISFSNLVVASIACIFLPVVTMFPVVLGYGNITYKDISNRGYGMMDISMIFGACFMATLWGVYLKGIFKGKLKYGISVFCVLVAVTDIFLFGQKFIDLVPVQIITNLSNGYNENYYETWMEIFYECEKSEGEDLVIEMSVPPRKAGCSWAKLSEDTDKWWNTSISQFYGLNSLSLVNIYNN